jgi:hypothetical protein
VGLCRVEIRIAISALCSCHPLNPPKLGAYPLQHIYQALKRVFKNKIWLVHSTPCPYEDDSEGYALPLKMSFSNQVTNLFTMTDFCVISVIVTSSSMAHTSAVHPSGRSVGRLGSLALQEIQSQGADFHW